MKYTEFHFKLDCQCESSSASMEQTNHAKRPCLPHAGPAAGAARAVNAHALPAPTTGVGSGKACAYPASSIGGAVFEHTYLGGERVGKPGRGSENKTAFVAALQTSTDGKPLFMRLFPNEVRARHPSERIVMVIGRWHWPEVLS